jgi:hypothetical protein
MVEIRVEVPSKSEMYIKLKGLYYKDKEILHLEQELAETESRLRRGCGLGGFRSDGSRSDITGNTAIAIIEYRDEINRKIIELYEEKTQAERYIQALDDTILRTVLRLRFIKFYSWIAIARSINSGNKSTPFMIVKRFFDEK